MNRAYAFWGRTRRGSSGSAFLRFHACPRWNGNQRRAFLPLPHCSLAPPACCAPQPLCGFQSSQINITKAMRPLQGPISLLAFHSIDVHAAIARNRKKVVAAGSRCESVYNRAGSRTYFFLHKRRSKKAGGCFSAKKNGAKRTLLRHGVRGRIRTSGLWSRRLTN